jgi:hypothetical protein
VVSGAGSRDGRAGADGRVERAELRNLFEDAAAGLNLGEREVIELQLRQGLAAGEVASVLGVSAGHAYLLLSRAKIQLESCLAVLLVGRAGRGDCDELRTLLAGWDGRLTATLRKRLQRHIEHCPTCAATRALELRPARLLNRSPGAALAAGASESFRFALDAPSALRAHTIALAAGHAPGAAANRSAVLARAGHFGKHGFPRPARTALSGLAGISAVRGRRFSPRRRTAAAVTLLAVTVVTVTGTVACALAGGAAHLTSAATPKPSAAVPAARSHLARTAAPAPQALSPTAIARPPAPVTVTRVSPAPATPLAPGIPVPGSARRSTPQDVAFIKPPRLLRSWIESNRLRRADARQRGCRGDRGGRTRGPRGRVRPLRRRPVRLLPVAAAGT